MKPHGSGSPIKTRVFDERVKAHLGFDTDAELAALIGMSQRSVNGIRRGVTGINGAFIGGCLLAFQEMSFDDLFYIEIDGVLVTGLKEQ